MSWPIKAALLCVFAVCNVGILWFRYFHQESAIKGVGPFVAALGAAQADTVIAWRNASSVALDHQAITEFVDRMKWENCNLPSQKLTMLTQKDLSSAEQQGLRGTVVSLLETYSRSDPSQLYDFMASIGEDLPQTSIDTLRGLLTSNSNSSSDDVSSLGPRELWQSIAQKIHYNAHWQNLVADSACVTLWRAPAATSAAIVEMPLGELFAKEFKNQTTFHHLFVWHALPARNGIIADVRFVVKHDHQLMSEPSAYFVRLVLDPQTNVWHPVEMIHVPTISGNSPPLLF